MPATDPHDGNPEDWGRPPVAAPRTREDWLQESATAAFTRGQVLERLDDHGGALHWLERAHRIAPADGAILFHLAMLHAKIGDFAQAAVLLERLTSRHDMREGWISLAMARLRLGEAPAAAVALGRALSRHVLPAEALLMTTAERASYESGNAGWCGLRADGTLAVHATGRVRVEWDGTPALAAAKVPSLVAEVSLSVAGRPLVGSPIAVGHMRRVEGAVWARDGGIEGWAWLPGDADTAPVLTVASDGGSRVLVAEDAGMVSLSQFARPRGFRLPAELLPGAGVLRVTGTDGCDLLGSPLDPGAEQAAAAASAQAVAALFPLLPGPPAGIDATHLANLSSPAALRGRPATAKPAPGRGVAVVIPVYRGLVVTLACLDSVFATVPAGTRIVVVDDASPEPELVQALDRLARGKRIRLLRHAENRGFPASANAGMRAAAALPGRRDLVLLNNDTLPAPGWVEALRAAVHSEPDRGSATPLSNDATILSYPGGSDPGSSDVLAPVGAALERLGRQAQVANPGVAVEIPTAVGFCMYVRHECLDQVGVFREDLFAQGYGEENDFCLRARHLGWRHVAVPGAYVAHVGGQSFGAARAALVARNLDVLERRYPGYRTLIADFVAEDPLAPARLRLDAVRWRAGRRPGSVILVTHDQGGGVERVVARRCAEIRAAGQRPILLRPERARGVAAAAPGARDHLPGICRVSDAVVSETPNLRFSLPEDILKLGRMLKGDRPVSLEVHHLLGHDHGLLSLAAQLGIPVDFQVHDYAAFCPRISLVREGRYCGEPDDPAVCEACIADHGRNDDDDIGVANLRARSADEFEHARRVIAPSVDTATRLQRHFPGIAPIAQPLEDDARISRRRPARREAGDRLVCVVGAIGPEKGYDVLLACARDAAARQLALRFVLVGHTPDDGRLSDTGRVFVTGPYADDQAVALIAAQQADLGWLPSICPETWSFTLGHAWAAGLDVAAFDLGAPAERIRASGRGWLMPLGLPAAAVNNALLALRPASGDVS